MKKLVLLFVLLVVVYAALLFLSVRQPATPDSALQIVRYSPSAIPAQPTDSTDRFDFIAYGDTRNGHDKHRTLINHIIALNPDLVIHTGDLVASGRRSSDWDTFFDIISPLANRVPYYTIRGNHDKGRNNYEKRFAPPNDSGTNRHYAFDYRNVHFIGLDTNEWMGKQGHQNNWLVQDLAEADRPHVVVFFHHPPFGISKWRGDDEHLQKAVHELFVKYGVNLVLAGHDHLYYRTARNGITYVTTGGGGAPLHGVDDVLAHRSTDVWGVYHHIVHFTVTGGLIKGTVIDIDGRIRDSFTVSTRSRANRGEKSVNKKQEN